MSKSFKIIIVIIGLVIAWAFISSLSDKPATSAASTEQQVYDKVVNDAVEQYQIATRQGDKMQICVQASLVSAAYLQAKDEVNYNEWKKIEKVRCETAGIKQ